MSLRFTSGEAATVHAAAAARGLSASDFIRSAIEQQLARDGTPLNRHQLALLDDGEALAT